MPPAPQHCQGLSRWAGWGEPKRRSDSARTPTPTRLSSADAAVPMVHGPVVGGSQRLRWCRKAGSPRLYSIHDGRKSFPSLHCATTSCSGRGASDLPVCCLGRWRTGLWPQLWGWRGLKAGTGLAHPQPPQKGLPSPAPQSPIPGQRSLWGSSSTREPPGFKQALLTWTWQLSCCPGAPLFWRTRQTRVSDWYPFCAAKGCGRFPFIYLALSRYSRGLPEQTPKLLKYVTAR